MLARRLASGGARRLCSAGGALWTAHAGTMGPAVRPFAPPPDPIRWTMRAYAAAKTVKQRPKPAAAPTSASPPAPARATPPPPAPEGPPLKEVQGRFGAIKEQPRAQAMVTLQNRLLQFHTVRAILAYGRDLVHWAQLAAGSANPQAGGASAPISRMDARLMIQTRLSTVKIIGWVVLMNLMGMVSPLPLTYAMIPPIVIGIWQNLPEVSPASFVKEEAFVRVLVREEKRRIAQTPVILSSLTNLCESILSKPDATPKDKADARKLLACIQNPPRERAAEVLATTHNLHDFFLRHYNALRLPSSADTLAFARFTGLYFEFLLTRVRLARRLDWIIARDDPMLLKPENDLARYDDADVLEAAEDRWSTPLIALYGSAGKVPKTITGGLEPAPQARARVLGSVTAHARFVAGMLAKYGEVPMPPKEDWEAVPEQEKERLRVLEKKGALEDKRFPAEELGAVGSLVVVGRALEIAAMLKDQQAAAGKE